MHFEGLMWPGVIVLLEPVVDDDLSLLGRREPFLPRWGAVLKHP